MQALRPFIVGLTHNPEVNNAPEILGILDSRRRVNYT